MKTLADKYNKGGEFYDKLYESSENRDSEMITDYHEVSRSSSITKIIFAEIIIAIFLLGAIKNPTVSQTKAEVKSMLLEQYYDNLRKQLVYTDSIDKQIESSFAMFIAPNIIDTWLQTDVSDYIFFSTFNSSLRVGKDVRAVMSGAVIFGKVVPLKYDMKKVLNL